MENNPEIIDLTQSYTFCRAPIILTQDVIELSDFSPVASPAPPGQAAEPIVIEAGTDSLPAVNVSVESQSKKSTATKKKKRSSTSSVATNSAKCPRLGDCPICRDPLGNRPMASTKCGHVYCITCIEQAVRIEKRCPTCRKPLKGATAFHPLFL